MKTVKKRLPPQGGVKFSKDHQPSGEAKSKGWGKRTLLRNLLDLKLKGDTEQLRKIRAEVAAMTGMTVEQVEELTIEALMHIRQQEKAIKSGDTYAYNSVLNREYGTPKQTVEHEGDVTVTFVPDGDSEIPAPASRSGKRKG